MGERRDADHVDERAADAIGHRVATGPAVPGLGIASRAPAATRLDAGRDGSALDPRALPGLARDAAAAFRVHVSPDVSRAARVLGTRAFGIGRDLFFARGEDARPDSPVLAHEVGHAVRAPRPRLECYPDPTLGKLDEAVIKSASNADLAAMEQAALDALNVLDDHRRTDVWGNLNVIQDQMRARKLTVKPASFVRVTAVAADRASEGEVTGLAAMIDVLRDEVRTMFAPDLGAELVAWLDHERTLLPQIAKSTVTDEGDLLQEMVTALDRVVTLRGAVPTDRSADADVAAAQQQVDDAIKAALGALQTVQRKARIEALAAAVDHFADAFSASLIRTLAKARDAVKASPNSVDGKDPVPELARDDAFINGYYSEEAGRAMLDPSWDQLFVYQDEREHWLEQVAAFGALDPTAPVAERLAFQREHEKAIPSFLRRAQGIVLLGGAFVLGRAFMKLLTEDTDQVVIADIFKADDLKYNVVDQLASRINHLDDDDLAGFQSDIDRIAKAMTPSFTAAQEFQSRVNTALAIVAMAASLYVGGVGMRAAIGADAAAFGTNALTVGQLVRGALGFSLASQMTTIALTGKAPSLTEAIFQTEVDVATFGLMHGLGLGLAARYGGSPLAVPAGVRATAEFTALWAWSIALGLGSQLLAPGGLDADKLGKISAEATKQTALGFLAMGIVHHMSEMPSFTGTTSPDPALVAARRAAFEVYEALRLEGKALHDEITARLESGESSAEIDALLEQAEAWYGKIGGALDALVDATVIDRAGADAILAKIREHGADLRVVRDAARLGLRSETSRVVAFSAAADDVAVFLSRLQASGKVKSFERVGDAGAFRVQYPDGKLAYWFPEAAQTEAGRGADFAEEYLRDTHPDLTTEQVGNVMTGLRTARGANASELVRALAGSGGADVVAWLARPGIAAALGASARGGELIGLLVADAPLRGMLAAHGEALIAWHDMPFEAIYGDRSANSLRALLSDATGYSGRIDVGPEKVKSVFANLRDAHAAVPFEPNLPNQPRTPVRDAMADLIRHEQLAGDFKVVETTSGTWFLQVFDGELWEAFHFGPKDTVPTRVFVAGELEELATARAMAIRDPSMTKALAGPARSTAEKLEFLRGIRGVDTAKANELLDLWAMRMTEPAPPVVTPAPAPATPPAVKPVTSRSKLGKARAEVLASAHRMGLFSDPAKLSPALAALDAWHPGDVATQPADPAAVIAAARAVVEAERERGTNAAKDYFGAGNEKTIRKEFASDTAAGEAYRLTLGKHARTEELMHGIALAMGPAPAGETGSPIPVEKLFENAPRAQDARLAFEMFGKLVDHNIKGAYRLLRDMAASPRAFRGGLFTMRAIADGRIPIEKIDRVEAPQEIKVTIDGVEVPIARRYDVVMKNGDHLEMKAWTRLLNDKIAFQFGKDAVLRTAEFRNPIGIREMRWFFDELPIVTEGDPPRSRTLTEDEARAAVLAQMEIGVAEQGKRLGKSPRVIENVLEQLRWYANRIINFTVLAP